MSDICEYVKKAVKVPKSSNDTNSDSNQLNYFVIQSLVDPIIAICRKGENESSEVIRYLILDLDSTNVIVRIRSLYIINILFTHSKLCRLLVCNSIKAVIRCGGFYATSKKSSTAVVRQAASNSAAYEYLESRVIELVEGWDIQWGTVHPQLHAVSRYFKESLRIKMPDMQAKAQEKKEKEMLEKVKLCIYKDKIVNMELPRAILDLTTTLSEMEECFNVLFPSIVADYDYRSVNASITSSSHSSKKRTIWECDGVEIDDQTVEEEKVDIAEDEDGDDDTEWMNNDNDIDGATVTNGQTTTTVANKNNDYGLAPHDIIIRVSDTASTLHSTHNVAIISTLKEATTQLTRHSRPHFLRWKQVLLIAQSVYKSRSLPNITQEDAYMREELKISIAIDRINSCVGKIDGIVKGRCNQLLNI